MATATANSPELLAIRGNTLYVDLHPGQVKAMTSRRRFILVLAGSQSGKTVVGPHWLLTEIQARGPGDYLVAAPTFPLLQLKALPEFLKVFKRYYQLGTFTGSPIRRFTFSKAGCARLFGKYSEDVHVYFGHAADPDSLEAATVKAAWLDEAGQPKFKLGSWEAVQRRLSVHQGRCLITTTPYNLGWLKRQVYDRWAAGDPAYDVIHFESIMNPAFPREEWERAKATLPPWRFSLYYRAVFSRPAGMIYDCFDEAVHKCPRFTIPRDWPRFLGLDFGGVNTAAVFIARDPGNGNLYLYREYLEGGRTAKEHAAALLDGEPGVPYCVGGSKSEGQWRLEFRAGGLPVREPVVNDVEVGINRVYGAFKRGELFVFDDLDNLLDEVMTYSRELDDQGEPLEKIAEKETFHILDSVRYITSYLKPLSFGFAVPGQPEIERKPLGPQPLDDNRRRHDGPAPGSRREWFGRS